MRKNKKLNDLVESAIMLFKKFGMKRVSIEEICSTANVSKATFYKHFKNKNELIKYIFNKWFDEGYNHFDQVEKMDIPIADKITAIFKIKKDIVENMSPEFIEEYLHISDELVDFFEDLKTRSYNKFLTYLEKWQDQGHIRKNIKPEFIMHAIESLDHFTKVDSLPGIYPEYINFIEEILNFFFYGILTERMKIEE